MKKSVSRTFFGVATLVGIFWIAIFLVVQVRGVENFLILTDTTEAIEETILETDDLDRIVLEDTTEEAVEVDIPTIEPEMPEEVVDVPTTETEEPEKVDIPTLEDDLENYYVWVKPCTFVWMSDGKVFSWGSISYVDDEFQYGMISAHDARQEDPIGLIVYDYFTNKILGKVVRDNDYGGVIKLAEDFDRTGFERVRVGSAEIGDEIYLTSSREFCKSYKTLEGAARAYHGTVESYESYNKYDTCGQWDEIFRKDRVIFLLRDGQVIDGFSGSPVFKDVEGEPVLVGFNSHHLAIDFRVGFFLKAEIAIKENGLYDYYE